MASSVSTAPKSQLSMRLGPADQRAVEAHDADAVLDGEQRMGGRIIP